MPMIDISASQEIYTVSRLNREARFLLEGGFPPLWIEGEISNFVAPHSGHWYFSLKDASSQIRCAMFKPHNRKLGFLPEDGMHVIAKARVSLYEGRGDFQLLMEHLEIAGEGQLQKAFEALKKRLQAAGLFAEEHKKPLPKLPNTIGVITSPTGAAIRDILTVLKRRYPAASIIIYPTLVQGDQAAPNIVRAIQKANQRNECDVLIVARGGGSIEDLWPFNEEIVAHAIFKSDLPIISGVGHEIDFTIADFVADIRAPTPSAAAELVTPDQNELLQLLASQKKHLFNPIQRTLQHTQQQLNWIDQHLQHQHPQRKLQDQTQKLDAFELALTRLRVQLLQKWQAQLNTLAATLDAISPLATLKRGYAIATRINDQRILHNAKDVAAGEKIQVKLYEGQLYCVVE